MSQRKKANPNSGKSSKHSYIDSYLNENQILRAFHASNSVAFLLNLTTLQFQGDTTIQSLFEIKKVDRIDFSKLQSFLLPQELQKFNNWLEILRSYPVNTAFSQEFSFNTSLNSIIQLNFSGHTELNEFEEKIVTGIITKNPPRENIPSNNETVYSQLFNVLSSNFALHEILLDEKGKPYDYRFLVINPAMAKAVGKSESEIIGKTAKELFPKTEQYWIDKFAEVALTGIPSQYENYSSELNRYYDLKLFCPQKGQFAMLATDITDQHTARQQINEAKEHFETLYNLLPDAVTITGVNSKRYVDVNNGFSKLMGYAKDEIIGKTISEYGIWLYPNDHKRFRNLIYKQGFCNDFETVFRHKDGHTISGSISSIIFDYDHQPCILSVSRDITKRKKTEDALRESELLLKESQKVAGLGTYKLNFKTGMWSSSEVLNKLFGIPDTYNKSVDGWLNLIHPKWQDVMKQYLINEVVGKHRKFDKEYLIIRYDDGSEKWVHGMGDLIFDDHQQLQYMIGTIQDITERKKTEIIIQQQNQALKDLDDTKNKLFSIIAHDLRTPFNALMNFSELLMLAVDTFNKDEIRKMASHMNLISNQTYDLLQNLLDWFRIQTGILKPNQSPHNVFSVTQEVLMLAKELARKKEIDIINKIDPFQVAVFDVDMTKTILRNLISNAIKYTSTHGVITLTSEIIDNKLVIKVTDNGVGIPPEIVPQIFYSDMKYSTPGTNNELGAGLGLNLCRELVEKQGGNIKVSSEVNQGSCFSFTLHIPNK